MRVLHNPTYESSNVEENRDRARALQNPTYEMTSSTTRLLTAESAGQATRPSPADTYDSLQPLSQVRTEKGQIYNVLDRGQTTGIRTITIIMFTKYTYGRLLFAVFVVDFNPRKINPRINVIVRNHICRLKEQVGFHESLTCE